MNDENKKNNAVDDIEQTVEELKAKIDKISQETPLDVEKINVKVTASVDGGATNTVYTESFDPETKSTTFELQGYEKATVHIYINDKLTKEQNITF